MYAVDWWLALRVNNLTTFELLFLQEVMDLLQGLCFDASEYTEVSHELDFLLELPTVRLTHDPVIVESRETSKNGGFPTNGCGSPSPVLF